MRSLIKWSLAAVLLGAVLVAAGFRSGAPDGAALSPPAEPRQLESARPTPADLTFQPAVTRAAELSRLRSLLISVDGNLVEEHYFHGASASRVANIKSASKSIIAILVGIAIDRGQISSVTDPIGKYFPEDLKGQAEKSAITVEDLLTMRSGLESTSGANYGRWVTSKNWVRHVLQRPMEDVPGGRMLYSTGTSHLLSAVLTRATRRSTLEYAREALGAPLGITIRPWLRDPQGIYLGGNDMPMLPREMRTIGEMYLNDGRQGDRQIVSSAWVQASRIPRTTSRWSGREYGYGWWMRTLAGVPVYYAWGYGGQFIFVVPDARTVVVTTSASEPNSERREHLDAIYGLLEELIIPVASALLDAAHAD